MQRRCCARRGYGNVVKYDEKEDGSWNVDIGVCCVDKKPLRLDTAERHVGSRDRGRCARFARGI